MTTILVIDDEPDFMGNTIEMLEFEGFNVIGSLDGTDAIKIANECSVDLILCDMLMKPVDGLQILTAIRQNPTTAAVPFVFVTGLKPNNIDVTFQGVSGFITKPFANDTFLSKIGEYLKI